MGPFIPHFLPSLCQPRVAALCQVFCPHQCLCLLRDGQRLSGSTRWVENGDYPSVMERGGKELGLLHSVAANLGKPRPSFTVLSTAATIANSESLCLCMRLCSSSAISTQQDILLLLHTPCSPPQRKNHHLKIAQGQCSPQLRLQVSLLHLLALLRAASSAPAPPKPDNFPRWVPWKCSISSTLTRPQPHA